MIAHVWSVVISTNYISHLINTLQGDCLNSHGTISTSTFTVAYLGWILECHVRMWSAWGGLVSSISFLLIILIDTPLAPSLLWSLRVSITRSIDIKLVYQTHVLLWITCELLYVLFVLHVLYLHLMWHILCETTMIPGHSRVAVSAYYLCGPHLCSCMGIENPSGLSGPDAEMPCSLVGARGHVPTITCWGQYLINTAWCWAHDMHLKHGVYLYIMSLV